MGKNILILGGSYTQSGFIETCLNKAYKVHVLDRDENCLASTISGVEFYPVDISDEEAVEKYYHENECDLIVGPVSEIGNRVAANISTRNDLLYNSLSAVEATTDKWVMRSKLKESSLHEPKVRQFQSKADILNQFQFPLIIKPPANSASRGVTLVAEEHELEGALNEAFRFISNGNEILIEEYIQGEQYSIETISSRGKHFITGIVREYISDPPYFVERTDITSIEQTKRYHEKFQEYVEQLLNILGVTTGPCHIEVKVSDDRIYLIEIASRSGLLRDRLLKTANGSDYNELILKAYSGDEINREDIQMPDSDALLGIMMTQADMEVYREAKSNGMITEEYFNGKKPVKYPKRLTDAFGYFFIRGDEQILKYKLN